MITEINAECEKSDRLTVAKLNAVKQYNKQDHKSKLMTEKYSPSPSNLQQLTPVKTAIQRMSEKHPHFEIEPVNTIQPPEIEYMSCNDKTASLSCELRELVSPRTSRESSAIDQVTVLELIIGAM